MKGFFSRPFEFSFKDLLAIFFTVTFLIVTFKAIKSKDALEVMKTLIPIISIVLGGYFGQEMVVAYMYGRNPNYTYPYSYYGMFQTPYIPPEEAINEESDTRGTI